MQLYNTLSNEEREKLIDQAGVNRLTLSFYTYAHIDNPQQFRDELFVRWSELDVLGRIYVAKEGINAQLSLPAHNMSAFKDFLDTYNFMKDIRLNIAVEHDNKSFLKLKIKVRDKIVADGLNDNTFDVTDIGIHLKAQDFNNMMDDPDTIIEYTRQIKSEGLKSRFIGKNFVFDNRLGERITDDVIAHCHQCGEPCDTHTNCANEGCHLLFIQCSKCAQKMHNCCSDACKNIVILPQEQRKILRKGIKNDAMIFRKGKAKHLISKNE